MKRIREFETRYIAKTNRSPTASRPWIFINSAFFLWLMSTVLIGFATFIYSQHQTCEINFQTNNDKFIRLLAEYQFRMLNFKEVLQSAKSKGEKSTAAVWMTEPPKFIHAD